MALADIIPFGNVLNVLEEGLFISNPELVSSSGDREPVDKRQGMHSCSRNGG